MDEPPLSANRLGSKIVADVRMNKSELGSFTADGNEIARHIGRENRSKSLVTCIQSIYMISVHKNPI